MGEIYMKNIENLRFFQNLLYALLKREEFSVQESSSGFYYPITQFDQSMSHRR